MRSLRAQLLQDDRLGSADTAALRDLGKSQIKDWPTAQGRNPRGKLKDRWNKLET